MEFKKIAGFENYLVSRSGIIKSIERKVPIGRFKKKGIKLVPEKVLKQAPVNVYLGVCLYSNDMVRLTKHTHRIVAETFLPNPLNLPQVNHIDGNKFNNDVSNLEWVTARENTLHAFKNKLRKPPLHNSKKIECIDLGICFYSASDAKRFFNAKGSDVHAAASGLRKKALKMTWKWI